MKALITATAALSAILLASCSSDSTPAAHPTMQPGTPADNTEISTQGREVKLGETFPVPSANAEGVTLANVTISQVEADPVCHPQFADPSPKGHRLAVEMIVETTTAYTDRELTYPTAYDFSLTGADGFTDANLYPDEGFCLTGRATFSPLLPSRKYRGWVLLDTSTTNGELTFRPHFMTALSGWTIKI